ncbi:hypothetical protein EDD17DRAFT_1504163 [Pisolithus thermaeus]|nr:hypothetical protein EDD17DRAFT_1504163 [Pisolithus thermaeus]
MASVTTTAANLLGLDYRLGYIKEGLVIWESHPLALGPTSLQVFIDGIHQLTNPISVQKESFQEAAVTPDFDDEARVGISTFLSLGAKHKLEKGAVLKQDAALLVGILHRGTGISISTQIAILHNLLLSHDNSHRGQMFQAVYNGMFTLAVNARNTDIIASLLALRAEVQVQSNVPMKMTINNVTVGIRHQGVEEVVMLTCWAAQNYEVGYCLELLLGVGQDLMPWIW